MHTNTDSIYIPVNIHAARDRRATQYYEVPLIWTGRHYLLPIDLADYSSVNMVYFDQPTGDEVHRSEVTEIEFPHKKILTAKDWNILAHELTKQIGGTIKFKNVGSETVRSRENVSSPNSPTQDSKVETPKAQVAKDVSTFLSSVSKRESLRPMSRQPVIPEYYNDLDSWYFWEWNGDGTVTNY